MEFNRAEHEEKLHEIMKKEGTYLKYLRWNQRAPKRAADIVEDIYDRHGQQLDGNTGKKYKLEDVQKGL